MSSNSDFSDSESTDGFEMVSTPRADSVMSSVSEISLRSETGEKFEKSAGDYSSEERRAEAEALFGVYSDFTKQMDENTRLEKIIRDLQTENERSAFRIQHLQAENLGQKAQINGQIDKIEELRSIIVMERSEFLNSQNSTEKDEKILKLEKENKDLNEDVKVLSEKVIELCSIILNCEKTLEVSEDVKNEVENLKANGFLDLQNQEICTLKTQISRQQIKIQLLQNQIKSPHFFQTENQKLTTDLGESKKQAASLDYQLLRMSLESHNLRAKLNEVEKEKQEMKKEIEKKDLELEEDRKNFKVINGLAKELEKTMRKNMKE